MAVLREAFELVRQAGGPPRPGRYRSVGIPGMDHRQLAQIIRRMPDRYHGRLPNRTLTKITGAAAAGQWEKAIHQLITALSVYAAPITAEEHHEIHTVLTAMHMPHHRADALPQRH